MITTESIRRILDAMHVRPETASLYAPHLDAAARAWGVADYALPAVGAEVLGFGAEQ